MLAGCDLQGAKLPASFRAEALTEPQSLPDAINYTRHLFWWLLAVCFFCWLSIGATRDVELIVNQGQLSLPVFGVEFPVVAFYWLAPPLLIGMFLYFQLYLQRQWDVLSQRPAVSVEGVPLDVALHGWIVLGLVRKHFAQLTARPPLFRMQTVLCEFLVWWVVPLTAVAFWWRYVHCHDVIGAVWLILMVAVAFHCSQSSLAIAVRTLRGEQPSKFRWRQHVITGAAVVALWALTMFAAKTASPLPLLDADLTNENLSRPPEGWTGMTAALPEPQDQHLNLLSMAFGAAITQTSMPVDVAHRLHGEAHSNLIQADEIQQTSRQLYRHVRGAQLRNANLKGAGLAGAFMGRAELSDADLRFARMSNVDLGWAKLKYARLGEARVWNATLIGADLTGADLYDCTLSNCLLVGADLSGVMANESYLSHNDFRLANLHGAYFVNADLTFARFNGANLTDARLAAADLRGADLRGAIGLRQAELQKAETNYLTLLPDFDESGMSIPLHASSPSSKTLPSKTPPVASREQPVSSAILGQAKGILQPLQNAKGDAPSPWR
jgi:uncharacterized protein YjbI with pentapeptide repeats